MGLEPRKNGNVWGEKPDIGEIGFYRWQKSISMRFTLWCRFSYCRLFRSRRSFAFNSKQYRYFLHPYNTAWRTERTVEIPIVRELLENSAGKEVLEVGNVFSHYYRCAHDVVDKYEKAPGVINQDIVNFRPSKKYDLIVSVSTLEHVGWDEEPKEPDKVLRAIDILMSCLSAGGTGVVTLPVGYNPRLDALIDGNEIPFTQRFCLKRVSADNRWLQAEWPEIRGSRMYSPFRAANGLVIGYF
jgi:hypothetical protein